MSVVSSTPLLPLPRRSRLSLSIPISEHSAELEVFGEPPNVEQPQDLPSPTCCMPSALPQAVNVWSGGHLHSHTYISAAFFKMMHTYGESPDTGPCHRRLPMCTVHYSPQRTRGGSLRAAHLGFAFLLPRFTRHQLARKTVVGTECAPCRGCWCLCLQWLCLATTVHSPTFRQFCRRCRAHSLRRLRWLQP